MRAMPRASATLRSAVRNTRGSSSSIAACHTPAKEAPHVNLVVDTHALVWYLSGWEPRLSARVRRAFSAAECGRSTIHVPVAVLFELVLL